MIGEDGATNSGFVVTDAGVVVIDTQGPRELAQKLREMIREVTDKPVIYVVNTHYHGDHTFGNQYFAKTRAIISHAKTRKNLIERDQAHRERFLKFFGEGSLDNFVLTLPTMTIQQGMTLRVGGRTFEIMHFGQGHTDGDLVVYLPEERILFSGDLVYNQRLPWVGDGDTGAWLGVLSELSKLDVQLCVPGHGDIGDATLITGFSDYLIRLRLQVATLMDKGLGPEDIKNKLRLPAYSGFKMYDKWLGLNAMKVYEELSEAR